MVRGDEVSEMGEGGQEVQTSSYKINKSWDIRYSIMTIINNPMVIIYTYKILHI